jgi:alkylation response protein AidB-like acyl-CoA dehydrogenase
MKVLGENGLMGVEVPAEYGGAGMDPISYVLAMIEVAAADAAHSTIMSVNNSLFCNGILKFGTEAQKQLYVRAIAEGREIGAFALTEPQSGSDATAMRCKATKQADGSFVINGKKSWITSGPVAKYIVLFAMTDPACAELASVIIDLAHRFRVSVVGVGVEEEAVALALRERGCDVAQGHLYGKAMAADAFQAWLDAHPAAPAAKAG